MKRLQQLIDAVKRRGADIAPTYSEYLQLALALATDCGEAGRSVFHQLCSPSPKYRQADADRMYTRVLRDGRGEVHLGTVFHLARLAGVEIEGIGSKDANLQNLQNLQPGQSLTHTHAYNRCSKAENPAIADDPATEEELPGSDPAIALPVFDDYAWPYPLAQVRQYGETPAQRDVLFLSTLVAIGACMGRHVRCQYGGKSYSPCFQLFVVAPPASGKGVLGFTRKFVEFPHFDIRRRVEKEMEAYRREKAVYDSLGKGRTEKEAPLPPKNRLFIIPGNNTGTGILQNLIDSDGTGIIFETEADTISTAIGTDYGHWSDTLRKAFDHDPLAYNRRTDREYREVARSYLSVILSGTPAQVKPLIPSAENGLFSRQLFYYMPSVSCWKNQFDCRDKDTDNAFRQLAGEWYKTSCRMNQQGIFDLVLDEEQKAAFNRLFASLFEESACRMDNGLASSVVRLGIIACRMLSVVAMLRMLENGGPQTGKGLARPAPDTAPDNLKDGIITRWEVSIMPEDFEATLSLIQTLYCHAGHILSFLPDTQVARRPNADRTAFFKLLPDEFTRQDMLQVATLNGIGLKRADSWLRRLKQKGWVETQAGSGIYRKRKFI